MELYFNLFWIIFSYILGSIPFGYIITWLSTKRNILKIGWRKTSGSNVFKNIGKWQGVLTGFLDVGKGLVAVRLVQIFGFSNLTQVLAGAAAVTGHNWSCFLKLAGGRGIGTFAGVALALSPKTLGISLVLPVLLALIWDASIGTILFLITFIFLSSYSNQFETGGLFGLICLMPIFIKRLSPIADLFEPRSKERATLIRNRLIFDDDKPCSEPRIKRIIKFLTKS